MKAFIKSRGGLWRHWDFRLMISTPKLTCF